MKLSPLERASLMSVREHGMDGVTPKVSSSVTNGGDECLITFLAGSPAIHVISLSFVKRLTASGRLELPWHRADKKVAFLGEDGKIVKPETPNAVKLEAFIFDALPLAERTMILEADRNKCFAPTKNATGVDSAESCRKMLSARDAERMRLAGISVPEGAVVELSPRDIFDDEDAVEFFRKFPQPAAYGR